MKGERSSLSAEGVRSYARSLQLGAGSTDGLAPANPNAWPAIPSEVSALVPAGGALMVHPNGHYVVVTAADPFDLPRFRSGGARRQAASDALALRSDTGQRLVIDGARSGQLTAPWVEFRMSSRAPGEWRTPLPADLARW
jgi:hypothetical protein